MTESPHPAPQAATQHAADAQPDPVVDELQPLDWSTARVALVGVGAWVVALLVTLVVPDLHTGDRSWWPWSCVAGVVLGLLGYTYLRRGRGNATGAH